MPASFGPYAACKAAVLRLVEAFAAELKSEGVRVNAVLPGTMDTPQNREAMPNVDLARWVRPEEVAETIAFLLDVSASGGTSAAIPVTAEPDPRHGNVIYSHCARRDSARRGGETSCLIGE